MTGGAGDVAQLVHACLGSTWPAEKPGWGGGGVMGVQRRDPSSQEVKAGEAGV